MIEKPNCPMCSGSKLAVVASRPNANSQRVECDCGVAGPWGKMEAGAWAQWNVLCNALSATHVSEAVVLPAVDVSSKDDDADDKGAAWRRANRKR